MVRVVMPGTDARTSAREYRYRPCRRLGLAVLAVVLVFGLMRDAAAASCIPLSPAEQEVQADVIVDGTVVAIVRRESHTDVTLRVDRVLKGTPGGMVVLEGALPGEIVAGEVPFYEGWQYWRLYLRELGPRSGRYYTSLCDGTRRIPAPEPASPGSSADRAGVQGTRRSSTYTK
jgi:hypothetical protein